MTTTIYRNFEQVADAEGARSALLAGGFRPASIKLNPHTPPKPTVATGTVSNIFDALTPGGPEAAARARHRSGAMLSIDIDDNEQGEQADAIMQGFGAHPA